jgi:hypothetical protein
VKIVSEFANVVFARKSATAVTLRIRVAPVEVTVFAVVAVSVPDALETNSLFAPVIGSMYDASIVAVFPVENVIVFPGVISVDALLTVRT